MFIGTISRRELAKRIRREFPTQTEKVHSSPKGKKGYNRQQDKKSWQRKSWS
jgi:hypothetical protein